MTPARAEALALAACLVVASLLFGRVLDSAPNYDEGVYLATDDALRAGEELGRDVFASQPPGFYMLLRAATAFPGDSVAADRILFLLVALVGLVAAWALVRTLVSPTAGVIAAAALAVAPAYAANAARISADVPAMAFALGALALLALARERRSTRLAAAAGGLLSLAVAVKLLAIVAVVPAAVLLLGRRRLALAAGTGAALIGAAFLVGFAGSVGDLYDDAVGFHRNARDDGSARSANLETVLRALHPRLAWPWLVLAGAVLTLVGRRFSVRAVVLWTWVLASMAFLTWHTPLLDHHFALLAAAASAAAGASLGTGLALVDRYRRLAAGAVGLVLAAALAQEWRALGRLPDPEPDVEAVSRLVAERTAPGETIVSDLPLAAHFAGRRLPGELVDTSAVRFEAGSLDPGCVLELADAAGARVVVVGRMFRTFPSLVAELERRFPQERRVGEISLRERDPAAARAAQASARGSCSDPPASR